MCRSEEGREVGSDERVPESGGEMGQWMRGMAEASRIRMG